MFSFRFLEGLTGSGKTRVLRHLQKIGEQVIDLEHIARHSGSAFGGLNKKSLNSQDIFDQSILLSFRSFSETKPVYIEYKGTSLGSVKVPSWISTRRESSTRLFLDSPFDLRHSHLLLDYQNLTLQQFNDVIVNTRSMLPPHISVAAENAINTGNRDGFIRVMMEYYDNSPAYLLSRDYATQIVPIEAFDLDSIVKKILKL